MQSTEADHPGEAGADDACLVMEWRGRDLALVPPPALWSLDDDALLAALFQPDDVPAARSLLMRDRRGRCLRLRPMDGPRVTDALLERAALPLRVTFERVPLLPWKAQITLSPRPYQEEALMAWRAAGYRGVVVLPTGGGKTFLGALAIADLGLWSLVVVPTIDLLHQWRSALTLALGCHESDIGVYGGGDREERPVTITTYESAQLHPELLRPFGLLVFDECHHLPAPTYRQIAERAYAPYRLGLSATPERADQEHLALAQLIGPEVYRRAPAQLAAAHYLASYDESQLDVTLNPNDRARYDAARAVYRGYIARRRLTIHSPQDFQRKVLWAGARDPEARAAMLAWREARSLALNAPAKLAMLETLFARHRDERVLVFSEYNSLVEEISSRFCIPSVTHKTPTEERRLILERFRQGRYSKLVTGRVLNEGVDVPDCAVAVIVSGTGVPREYVQRLGRILRPKERRAVLYELVTQGTTEERIAGLRKEH